MASRLSWWLGGTVVACVVVAAALLPPRGMDWFHQPQYEGLFRIWREPRVSAAQQEVNRLAGDLRVVQARLRAATYRNDAARQDAGQGPLLVVGSDTAWESKQVAVREAVDSAWYQLGIEDPKISVLVAVPARTGILESKVPGQSSYDMAFVLPDTAERTTCVAILPVYWRGEIGSAYQRRQRTSWFRRALGPCAFYARFGAPSPRVYRWLRGHEFDIGESADWTNAERPYQYDDFRSYAGTPLWALSLYAMPMNTVACLAGRLPACTATLRDGDVADGRQFSNVLTPRGDFRAIDRRFVTQASLLASVVRDAGPREFQQFWTTDLPVDSALTLALQQSSAQWVNRWQLRDDKPPRLGAAPTLNAVLTSLLLALIFLSLVTYFARFRQVQ